MKKILLVLALILILFSCKKNNDVTQVLNTYSVDGSTVYPSSGIIITSNNKITQDTATISVGGQSVVIAKIDTFQYGMIVPILSPGNYKIDLSSVKGTNTPEITVGNYAAITNAQVVIDSFQINASNLIDSIVNTGYKRYTSSNDSLFLRQLLSQIIINSKNATDAQKLAIAYSLRQMDFTPANNVSVGKFDTSYLSFNIQPKSKSIVYTPIAFGIKPPTIPFGPPYLPTDDEIATQVWNIAQTFPIYVAKTARACGLVAVTVAVAKCFPNIYTYTTFGAAMLYFVTQMKTTEKVEGQVLGVYGIATGLQSTSTSSNPIVFNKGVSISQKIIGIFRSINTQDSNDPNWKFITTSESQLASYDSKIKSIIDFVLNTVKAFFSSVTTTYDAYVPQIKSTINQKMVQVNNKFLTLTNISNLGITLTGVDDGINGLKIVASNPANNLTTNTNFSFTKTYTQAKTNNIVTVTEQATYVPQPPVVLTTTAISNISTTTAATGGNITSDAGATITARGICWATTTGPTINNFTANYGTGMGVYSGSCTNLTANTNYYVRAYATNANGTFYGNEISFTTTASRSGITVAGDNGIGNAANQLAWPKGVFVDGSGNIYVADDGNSRIQKWPPGANAGATLAGGNGVGNAANQLSGASSVFVDGSGNIYVADEGNFRIQKWALGATVGVTVAGGNGRGNAANQLGVPTGVFVDGIGNIYISDGEFDCIKKWSPGATTGVTVAGGNGRGIAANQISSPSGLFVDGIGNIYVADDIMNRIQKWAPGATAGVTVAGDINGNSGNAANQLASPSGVYVDGIGNIYISDRGNSRIQKWAAGASAGVTVAGNNIGGALTGLINQAYGVFVDDKGYIYICDYQNQRIQKWPPM